MHKLALIFLLLLSLSACARNSQQVDDSGVQMDVQIASESLFITLHDADGNPIDNAYLTIKGDMTHAGMIPVIATADGGTDGVYSTPFEWTMGGDWVITVVADLRDGTTISREFPFIIQ